MTISVSSGIDARAVPDVSGLTERQAELDLEKAGLTAGEPVLVSNDRVPRGRVIGSDPASGTAAPAGAPVRLLVSLGPQAAEFIMPSLVGRTPEDARAIAEGLGLVVRSVTYGRGGRTRGFREIVELQDPPPGARVREGEGVTLRVGRG